MLLHLKAKMELEITDTTTGEVIRKEEEVFLGDFPLMTETGTFIINGAERVIVSQIVRSPGAYFSTGYEEKTGKTSYSCELIPSRGTWLEFMTELKKSSLGRQLSVSIDRKRKDPFQHSVQGNRYVCGSAAERRSAGYDPRWRLSCMRWAENGRQDLAIDDENREYMNLYLLLYTAFFGKYEEVEHTLLSDKVKTTQEALLSIYENQRSDEIPTLDGSITLMNAKFFDPRRYDLTKAGRFKLGKKAKCGFPYVYNDTGAGYRGCRWQRVHGKRYVRHDAMSAMHCAKCWQRAFMSQHSRSIHCSIIRMSSKCRPAMETDLSDVSWHMM